MVELGYALSSEEHQPNDLVCNARRAEESGFSFALISDHFHPWVDRQGQSPFVWNVIGAIAHVTERLRLGTGVTCPLLRIHPALVAQAAATSAAMMPGRFFLGLGTGENLNEHIIAQRWPSADERRAMLSEAIGLIRQLWQGGMQSFEGCYYHVEDARIYTLPETLPEIMVAASGPAAATLAGEASDGLISTSPKPQLVQAFEAAGGNGKPRFGQLTVCWARDEAQARRTALEYWPTAAVPGELGQELPLPRHFEQAAQNVTEEAIAKAIACGPDAQRHIAAIREFADAGFDHVYVHQVGPDQQGFLDFYQRDVLPAFR
jgi:G6PDH family F420-dependent oxidoreductase